MAKADKVTTYERREVKKYEDVKTEAIQLVLTKEEAKALRAVLGHVGGAKEYGRKHADAILSELNKLGTLPGTFYVTVKHGGLYFEQPTDYFTTSVSYGVPVNPFNSNKVNW